MSWMWSCLQLRFSHISSTLAIDPACFDPFYKLLFRKIIFWPCCQYTYSDGHDFGYLNLMPLIIIHGWDLILLHFCYLWTFLIWGEETVMSLTTEEVSSCSELFSCRTYNCYSCIVHDHQRSIWRNTHIPIWGGTIRFSFET